MLGSEMVAIVSVPRKRGERVKRTKTYHIAYERDDSGWWIASVKEIKGCHTQGRTVDEARRRIREALGLFVDDAATATLRDAVKLPAKAQKVIGAYRTTRARADSEESRARKAARRAVRVLSRKPLGLSARDAGTLLGLSHQRVHQLRHK